MKNYSLRRGEAPDFLEPTIASAFLQRTNVGSGGIEALRLEDKFVYALFFRPDPEDTSGPVATVYQLVDSRTLFEWFCQNYAGVVFYVVEGRIARVYAYEPPWLKELAP